MFRKTMIGAMHVLVLGALLVPVVQAAVPAEDGQHAQTSSPAVDTFTAAAREHGAAGYGNVQMGQLSPRSTVDTFTAAAREHGAAGYGN